MSTPTTTIVTVTGATGYVAGAVIGHLFDLNQQTATTGVRYEVRGTVRSIPSSGRHALHDAFPDLKLFEADLLQPGSFDQSFAGLLLLLLLLLHAHRSANLIHQRSQERTMCCTRHRRSSWTSRMHRRSWWIRQSMALTTLYEQRLHRRQSSALC
jgi:hypothetical protein